MSGILWFCECGAKYEIPESGLDIEVRCSHCGAVSRREKLPSIQVPPPIPNASVTARDTSGIPLNKAKNYQEHDRQRNPPDVQDQKETDIYAGFRLQAMNLGLAAEKAGITQFDDFVSFSVKTIGEAPTRKLGAYLKRIGEIVGMGGVRQVRDVLNEIGLIRVKDLEGEITSLESICSSGVATFYDLHKLGIAYHNYRDLAKAIKYLRLSAAAKPVGKELVSPALIPSPWLSLAMVYSDSELSQDSDAADACRHVLAVKPDHERKPDRECAKELLEITKRKLLPLAAQALSAASELVESDEFFDFYINPFEILQVSEITAANALDAKAIQQAKKRLLHELELNDGKVSWLDDYSLDKARAVAVVDELDDETKRRYHLAFYRNDRLLNFLTRGDIQHFLYQDDYFPCDTEELLHREPGCRKFLSKPFAKQYNRVLSRAIDKRRLPVVEVLFDGRRWIEPEDADQCFAGAYKRFGEVVEELKAIVMDGSSRKVSLREIEDFLRKHSLPELFNLLPVHFASYQREVVAEIRSLAISCFNTHGDSILSRDILSLCKWFTTRDVVLNKQLQDDFKAIEAIVSADRTKRTTNATRQVTSEATKIWFYLSKGKECGPFDPDYLIQRARLGEITPVTMVRCQGHDYSDARNIGFLATVFENATTAIPQRPAPPAAGTPAMKMPTVILPKTSDPSRSPMWHFGQLVVRNPLIALIGVSILFFNLMGPSTSTNRPPSSRPDTPSVPSTDPVSIPTVPPPNLLPAVPLPANGTIKRYGFSEGIAPLTIATRTGSGHYFVKLRNVGTRELIAEVFVREGQKATIKVPLGTYELTYATGRTWYGRKGSFFGPETRYTKADDTFTFRIEGDQVIGFTVELYLQSHGNLETEPISAREF